MEPDDAAFDSALISAAFDLAARRGWQAVHVATAARQGGLDLRQARARFPTRFAILARFGVLADQSALGEAAPQGSVRERLFDMIMRRIDVLQAHRDGVDALLRALPMTPTTGLALASLSRRSMAWLLDAAGVDTHGCAGAVRVRGLLAVWLWTVRAWQADASVDLGATMAALDRALDRAEWAAGLIGGGVAATPSDTPQTPPSEALPLVP